MREQRRENFVVERLVGERLEKGYLILERAKDFGRQEARTEKRHLNQKELLGRLRVRNPREVKVCLVEGMS